MAVVKLSASGLQVQFIDDEGNMFVTSMTYLMTMLERKSKLPFCLLSRLPLKISTDRFKKSPVWDPDGLADKSKQVTLNDDGLSKKTIKKGEQREQYKDKQVW